MFRTHKITATSTVHSERKLPFEASTTVDELADLQMKQLRNQRLALEGWDRVSMDMYPLSLLFFCNLPSHYHIGEDDVGHILRCCVTDMSNKPIFSFDSLPVAERFSPFPLSSSTRLRAASPMDLPPASPGRDGNRGDHNIL